MIFAFHHQAFYLFFFLLHCFLFHCYECLYPFQNSYVEILMLDMRALGRSFFGRWLDREVGGFINGVSVFIKEISQNSPAPFCHVRTQWEGASYTPGRGPSPGCDHPGTLILDFQASRIMRNKFLFFISYSFCGFCYRTLNGLRHPFCCILPVSVPVSRAKWWDNRKRKSQLGFFKSLKGEHSNRSTQIFSPSLLTLP